MVRDVSLREAMPRGELHTYPLTTRSRIPREAFPHKSKLRLSRAVNGFTLSRDLPRPDESAS